MTQINALPSKAIYRALMQDYNINIAICELIDNIIDNWKNNWLTKIDVDIFFDFRQNIIKISDNTWWILDLRSIIAPWVSWNNWNKEIIWFFWVWSKRAVVALAEKVEIKTRRIWENIEHLIEYDKDWLLDDTKWILEDKIKTTPLLKEWTTEIELSKLRVEISEDVKNNLIEHIKLVYSKFIENKLVYFNINWIQINDFIALWNWWKYDKFEPNSLVWGFNVDWYNVSYKITWWLKTKLSSSWEYGVSFYCNDRLIISNSKDKELWYETWKAWLPHPYASLWQFIVELNWTSWTMPWNSSKTWINYSLEVFKTIQEIIQNLVIYYTKISRQIASEKKLDQVVEYNEKIKCNNIKEIKDFKAKDVKTYLPEKPKRTKIHIQSLKEKNELLYNSKPWLQWIIESFIAIEQISKLNLIQKNRIIFILLDSNFEIWIKEYLVHEKRIWNTAFNYIKENRTDVINKVKSENSTNSLLISNLDKTNYYYLKRNDLIHQRTTSNITDKEIEEYSIILNKIFIELFWLTF